VSAFERAMRLAFGDNRLRGQVALAPFTTFRVGGPAEWLIETRNSDEIVVALRIAHREQVPVTMLGGGSNVLVSDRGVGGLVVRTRGGDVSRIDDRRIRAEAAVTINGLVRWTINHGVAGVEAWAGTPGTVGGAIHGNAHFGGRLIGDLVESVRLADRGGSVHEVPAAAMAFGYDRSRLQSSGEILLSAVFLVSSADPPGLRATARASLAFRKRTQPLETPSAGCIFQNPDRARGDVVPDGVPPSAGALIDRAGLRDTRIGGARISPTHANFFLNDKDATAADIRRLLELARARVREQFGVDLRDEIIMLGEF
jgi:UDP-N-acetylmuramate dehydrogenase